MRRGGLTFRQIYPRLEQVDVVVVDSNGHELDVCKQTPCDKSLKPIKFGKARKSYVKTLILKVQLCKPEWEL